MTSHDGVTTAALLSRPASSSSPKQHPKTFSSSIHLLSLSLFSFPHTQRHAYLPNHSFPPSLSLSFTHTHTHINTTHLPTFSFTYLLTQSPFPLFSSSFIHSFPHFLLSVCPSESFPLLRHLNILV